VGLHRPDRPRGWLRLALREQGYAVRRGETFPGLHADWLRVAVRDTETSAAFVAAVGRCLR
jgi:histidinol-phosphate/aromatic aminotransferase/cobyric acid decarboxylase-like protein